MTIFGGGSISLYLLAKILKRGSHMASQIIVSYPNWVSPTVEGLLKVKRQKLTP
jgi:hypothetical protein